MFQLWAEYIVDIYINNKKTGQRKLPFVAGKEHQLIPQFTLGQLRELGLVGSVNHARTDRADNGLKVISLMTMAHRVWERCSSSINTCKVSALFFIALRLKKRGLINDRHMCLAMQPRIWL